MEGKTRICNSCKTVKSIEDFHKSHTTKSGLMSKCKVCVASYDLTRMRTIEGRFVRAKSTAKYRKKVWEITLEQFKDLIGPNKCHYCNGKLNETSVGLDRIDSSKGYTISNVTACCNRCNLIRGEDNISYGEMKALAQMLNTLRSQLTASEKEERMISAIREYLKEQDELAKKTK